PKTGGDPMGSRKGRRFECLWMARSIGVSRPASRMDDSKRASGSWARRPRFEKKPGHRMGSRRAAHRLKKVVLIFLSMFWIGIKPGARAQPTSTNRQRLDTGMGREISRGELCALWKKS